MIDTPRELKTKTHRATIPMIDRAPSGSQEEWDEYFHKSKVGDDKRVICDSCLVVSQSFIALFWTGLTIGDSCSLSVVCVGTVLSATIAFRCVSNVSLTSPTSIIRNIVLGTLGLFMKRSQWQAV